MIYKIYKKMTLIIFVMIFLVMMMGVSCIRSTANQNEEISTSISIQNDLNPDEPKQLDVSSSDGNWIYFDDLSHEGNLYKMTLDGRNKATLPVNDINEWFIHKDKIIYSTVKDWSKLDVLLEDDNVEHKIFINQLKMMNLDGTDQVIIAQDLLSTSFDAYTQTVVKYTPLFVTNNRIYFEVSAGKPYTDYMFSYICSVNEDLTEFKIVPNFSCGSIDKIYLADKGLYLTERVMGEPNNLYFIDLETGEHQLIQEEIYLVGTYKDKLYYMGYQGDEGMKLYKIPINSVETQEVAQLAKFYFLEASNIVGNKLYFKYTKDDDQQNVIIQVIDLDTQVVYDVNENEEECLYTYQDNGILENGQTWYYYIKRNEELNSPEGIGKINLDSGHKMDILEGINVNHMQIVSVPKEN